MAASAAEPQGVHIGVVLHLLQEAQKAGAATTTDACSKHVLPTTAAAGHCAYAALPGLRDRAAAAAAAAGFARSGAAEYAALPVLGRATHFVSHAWRYELADVVGVLQQIAQEAVAAAAPPPFFWFDLAINNQHSAPDRPFSWWTTTFRDSIAAIGAVVLILSPWDSPIPLTRAWCLWELYCAADLEKEGVTLDVRLPTAQRPSFVNALVRDFSAALSALVGIDVANAEAFNAADRDKILQAVNATVGTAQLNALAGDRLRRWFRSTALAAVEETRAAADDADAPDSSAALGHAKLCSQLGTMLLQDYGDLGAAKPLLERSLRLRQAALAHSKSGGGPDAEEQRKNIQAAVAVSHNALGVLHREAGDFASAKAQHAQALALQQEAYGSNSLVVGITYNNMAALAEARGDYGEALELLQQDLAIAESAAEAKGAPTPAMATTLHNMANIFFVLGRYPHAGAFNERAYNIRMATLGERHPDTAESLSNQGLVLAKMGDAAAAAQAHERALAIRREIYGEKHVSVAASFGNLGLALLALGQAEGALESFSRAAAIQEALLGPDSAQVATTENNLAMTLERLGRAEEALARLEAVRAKRAAALGDTHALVAQSDANLAMVLERLGRLPEALAYGERALGALERALGADHPEVASTCNNLGSTLAKTKDFERALAMHHRALELRRNALGEEHLDVASSYEHVASVFLAQGKLQDAVAPLRASLDIRGRLAPQPGAETPEMLSLRMNLAQLAKAANDAPTAVKHLSIVLEKHTGASPKERMSLLNNLGASLLANGQPAEALPRLEEARALVDKAVAHGIDVDKGERCAMLMNIGKAKRSLGQGDEAAPLFAAALALAKEAGLGGGHPLVQALLQEAEGGSKAAEVEDEAAPAAEEKATEAPTPEAGEEATPKPMAMAADTVAHTERSSPDGGAESGTSKDSSSCCCTIQ